MNYEGPSSLGNFISVCFLMHPLCGFPVAFHAVISILCLQEEGWKLNRNNYYQEGWLATGNVRGVVGVTFTSSHARRPHELPLRTNYNLRGHRSDVSGPLHLLYFGK